jgi:hypothetical protein
MRRVKLKASKGWNFEFLLRPEAPPPDNTDYMFSIRPEFFGRKDCKGHAFAILPKVGTNSTNFYN